MGFERRISAGAWLAGRVATAVGGGVIERVVSGVIVGSSVTFRVVVLVNWLTDPDPRT